MHHQFLSNPPTLRPILWLIPHRIVLEVACAQLCLPGYNCKILSGTRILGVLQLAAVVAQLWSGAPPTVPGCQLHLPGYNCRFRPNTLFMGLLQHAAVVWPGVPVF